MAGKTLKIMGFHGLGDHRTSDWEAEWEAAVRTAFPGKDITLEFQMVNYDDIFETTKISALESATALWKLAKSGVSEITRRQRGTLTDISDKIKWTAGYVVAWVEDEEFKRKTRQRVLDSIQEYKPDIVLAHSLGSLITYNAFTHHDTTTGDLPGILAKTRYITFGSQIANPFVIRNLTNGRVQQPGVRFWYHLYNVNDDVFTAPIRLFDTKTFSQTDTPFDDEGYGDHSAPSYLGHSATIQNVWRSIAAETTGAKVFAPAIVAGPRGGKKQKALLVGINDYPNPEQRLEGCINDVFTMSAVLQDCGFAPESIRTCLDGRATADGILSRLKWLLDDPKPGDELIFYYSGHGAQVPEYGENFEPDHYVETLVPWDFDWSPEKFISDDQIYGLYSQLPYDCRLVLIFDCCHSGGIHRAGGARPRGITPPDDIRHRELKWDGKTKMWVQRDFDRINKDFTAKKSLAAEYFGQKGSTERIGRASMLRGLSASQYTRLKKENDMISPGPYLPVIIEACGEGQFSYEYRHGAASHGAFTYVLAKLLREEKKISFEALIAKTREQLADLQYDQEPKILGPTSILQYDIPWTAD